MNVFSKKGIPEPNFPRNTFDLSRQDMLTTEWAKLNVAYCKEVLPGDSWQLSSSVTVNAMPTVFPLSTPVKVYMHYYYVRNRTLYKDFEDFIFKTKDGLTPPWLHMPISSDTEKLRVKTLIGTRSYGDSFGVPSTFAGSVERTNNYVSRVFALYPKQSSDTLVIANTLKDWLSLYPAKPFFDNISDKGSYYSAAGVGFTPVRLGNKVYSHFIGSVTTPLSVSSIGVACIYDRSFLDGQVLSTPIRTEVVNCTGYDTSTSTSNYITLSDSFVSEYNSNSDKYCFVLLRSRLVNDSATSLDTSNNAAYFIPFNNTIIPTTAVVMPFTSVDITSNIDSKVDVTDPSYLDLNPFVGDTPSIPLSSLPWRAVEQCYNFYYRNDINNPYMINGEVQYNEFIPSHDGGPDDCVYPVRYRNWEMDRYTSCAPSPQYGEAPLVGLVGRPGADTATVQFADGDGNTYNATVGIDADGNVDSIVDYDRDIPSGSLRYLEDAVSSANGFSINDLRSVNSFQRFLENTIRRGLRYRNQLKSHFGVTVDYPDIDVPQFIGGYSGSLNTPRVMQSATTAEASLGDFNGQIVGTISSDNDINCYCPEHGFIIGIMSIIPVPTYSQTLDPMLTRMSAFDYFQQEFSKIGNVPIYMKEVAPIQASDPSTIFGYQKAWSEYMQDYDRVHGDFRTTLSDFMLMRTFADEPTLSRDFTVANASQMNDVFAAGKIADEYGSTDRLLCQVNHRISVKRQIPRYGTPSLE